MRLLAIAALGLALFALPDLASAQYSMVTDPLLLDDFFFRVTVMDAGGTPPSRVLIFLSK